MVFSSIICLLYFLPVFFVVYYLVEQRYKNAVILVASLLYCAWGAPLFIFVLLAAATVDFYLVKMMAAAPGEPLRRTLRWIALVTNICLFVYFKYSGALTGEINHAFPSTLKSGKLEAFILPMGLSYFTFSTVTYISDVYNDIQKPVKSLWDYLLYLFLFPKFLAGPIIPSHDFAVQTYAHIENDTIDNRLSGLYRFCMGLGKKVLIANVLGVAAGAVFSLPVESIGTITVWLGAISYALEIYFDFSGYTDMAIGLGLMMGFRLPENFKSPYAAVSVTDFWQRWHITFVSWLKNYLYEPFAGRTPRNKWRRYFVITIVVLFAGLWHRAAWSFIAWAAFHGLFLLMEHVFLGKWLRKLGKPAVIYTFFVTVTGWVFFRAATVSQAARYLGYMFSWHNNSTSWQADREFITTLIIALFLSFFTLSSRGERLQQKVLRADFPLAWHFVTALALLIVFIVSVGRIASTPFTDFIYAAF